MAAADLLRDNPHPTEAEIREGLEGNLCRCTGYQNIVRAVAAAAAEPGRRHDRRHATQPATEVGQRPAAQGGRAPDHRADHLDRQHHPARHAAHRLRAQPVRARQDHLGRAAPRARSPAWSPRSPARTSPTSRAGCPAPGRSRRTSSSRRTRRSPSTRSATSARRWPASSPGTGTRRRTRWRPSTSTTSSCPRCWTSGPRWTRARPRCTRRATRASSGRSAPATSTRRSRAAPVVIERNYLQQRLIPAPWSRARSSAPRGREITLWSATQIPHILRVMLALVTGIPEQKIRVIAPDVGGGFGGKLQVTAEEVLALLVARRLGKPVKWTESRSEGDDRAPRPGPVAAHQDRGQAGRPVRGLEVDLLADMGAYLMLVAPGVPVLGAFMFNAIYKFPAYRFGCTGVFTTKMPTDAYRGAGRPEATFGIERIMDELAAELGMDPMELREQNWIKHEEFPFTTIAGLTYDCGNYEAATAKASELFGYDELRAEQAGAPGRQRPGPARHRHLDLHRDVRPGALAGARLARLRGRRLGARLGADAADRQGRGGHRLERARAGPRDGVEPDRRRRARAWRSRTSRCCTATPRCRPRGWTPTARGRWWSAA